MKIERSAFAVRMRPSALPQDPKDVICTLLLRVSPKRRKDLEIRGGFRDGAYWWILKGPKFKPLRTLFLCLNQDKDFQSFLCSDQPYVESNHLSTLEEFPLLFFTNRKGVLSSVPDK